VIEFICAFLVFYWWHMLGVTIGYHRLLSHRSFKCPKLVEYFWVLGGYLAFEGSPLWWATMHRAHHRYTDAELDPHAPRFGWLNAYYGWIFGSKGYPSHIDPATQSKDLSKDPIYQYLEQGGNWHRAHALAVIIGLAFRVILLFAFGWRVALASLLAGGIVQQVPLLLNVVCHIPKLGYKNYATGDDSVNVWWVAMLTGGEGWHNNHHAFPGSARSGLKPHEFDLSWVTLRLQKALGLVQTMNEASATTTPASQ
jgi:stearoyl-CoA desaturase (delta-9 desaturase)